MRNLSYENKFDFHGNEKPADGTQFHMICFALTIVLRLRQKATSFVHCLTHVETNNVQ